MKILTVLLLVLPLSFLFIPSALAQTTYTWNGGVGDWNVPGNWTPVGVPGAADSAIIASGNVSLVTAVTVAGVELSSTSSTISGDFDLIVTDSMIWNGGVMQGNGTTQIASGATLRLASANQKTLYRSIDNDGTTIWEDGQLYLGNVVYNNNGAFLDKHSSDQGFSGGTFGAILNNNGTYVKSGAGESDIRVIFHNNSSLDLQAGTMELNYQGTSSGTFDVGSGCLLKVAGIPWEFSGTLSGAGTVEFWSPTTIKGIYNITGTSLFVNNLTKFDTSATVVSLNNGEELLITGTVEFNTGDEIVIDSLNLIGTFQGSDSLTIMESMIWSSNVMGGTGVTRITSGATLRLTGSNQKTIYRTIENDGTTIWEDGQLYWGNVVFNNNGAFLDQHSSDQGISGGTNGGVFNNHGTYTKTGAGESEFRLPFYNVPDSDIQGTGSMRILDTFTNEGSVSPGDSIGTLTLDISNYPTNTTSSLNIEISGPLAGTEYDKLEITGTATLNGTLNINLLNGYIPDVGEEFNIMSFNSRVDTFDVVNGWLIGGCKFFTLQYSDSAVILVTNEISGNNPPVANPDSASTVRDSMIAINVLFNDTDPDNDSLFLFDVFEPLHGRATITADSIINYTPDSTFIGVDSFTYTIRDLPGCFSGTTVTIVIDTILTGLDDETITGEIPTKYALEQNYPNPFNPITTIEFDLPKSSRVTLKVFNILGEEMATLISDRLSGGSYSYDYDASKLASGVYLYRLEAGDYIEIRKMILMK